MMRRIAIAPSRTTGRSTALLTPTIATSGGVYDRGRGDAAELAEARDRDRGAGELVAGRLVAACRLGNAADLGREVVQRAGLGMLHDRHL